MEKGNGAVAPKKQGLATKTTDQLRREERGHEGDPTNDDHTVSWCHECIASALHVLEYLIGVQIDETVTGQLVETDVNKTEPGCFSVPWVEHRIFQGKLARALATHRFDFFDIYQCRCVVFCVLVHILDCFDGLLSATLLNQELRGLESENEKH